MHNSSDLFYFCFKILSFTIGHSASFRRPVRWCYRIPVPRVVVAQRHSQYYEERSASLKVNSILWEHTHTPPDTYVHLPIFVTYPKNITLKLKKPFSVVKPELL